MISIPLNPSSLRSRRKTPARTFIYRGTAVAVWIGGSLQRQKAAVLRMRREWNTSERTRGTRRSKETLATKRDKDRSRQKAKRRETGWRGKFNDVGISLSLTDLHSYIIFREILNDGWTPSLIGWSCCRLLLNEGNRMLVIWVMRNLIEKVYVILMELIFLERNIDYDNCRFNNCRILTLGYSLRMLIVIFLFLLLFLSCNAESISVALKIQCIWYSKQLLFFFFYLNYAFVVFSWPLLTSNFIRELFYVNFASANAR